MPVGRASAGVYRFSSPILNVFCERRELTLHSVRPVKAAGPMLGWRMHNKRYCEKHLGSEAHMQRLFKAILIIGCGCALLVASSLTFAAPQLVTPQLPPGIQGQPYV